MSFNKVKRIMLAKWKWFSHFLEPCFVLGGCHKFPIECNRDLGECELDSNLTRKGNVMESKEVTLELQVKINNTENVKPNWMGIYIDDQEHQLNGKYGVVFIASIAFPKSVRKNM